MESELIKATEDKIQKILKEGITTSNLVHLYKLSKIRHLAKEDENMRDSAYGNYGRDNRYGREQYGEGSYGRRSRDSRGRYRGHERMDEMYEAYSRYSEGSNEYRESGNYGAKEDSMKNLEYMLECMVELVTMLMSEAETPDERSLIKKYTKKLSEM